MGYLGLYSLLAEKIRMFSKSSKAQAYLLGLEQSGVVFPSLFESIGRCFMMHVKYTAAQPYIHRAIELGSPNAYLLYCELQDKMNPNSDSSGQLPHLLSLIEERGLRDEVVVFSALSELTRCYGLTSLQKPIPLYHYASLIDMALTYANMLVSMESPRGYRLYGELYDCRAFEIPTDPMKAIEIWEEADRRGLATCLTLSRLITRYRYVPPAILSSYLFLTLHPNVSLPL